MNGALLRITGLLFALSALGACASSKTMGASLDDFSAAQTVRTKLFADRSHDYSDVDITLYEGRLMLTGTMRSEDGRKKLIANAWKAENVRQVIDQIFVGDKTPRGQGFADSRIDQAINAKLLTDRGVNSADYHIAVSRGVVYVLGVARDEIALDRALNHARSTSGVKQVVSHVIYKDDPQRQAIRY
ncbi:MAG: BON domain-containing protein [Pseudomonadota bacterium]